MNKDTIHNIVEKQRRFFYSGKSLDVEFRIKALKKLQNCIRDHETQINEAIRADLGKSGFESYMCETGLVLSEISYMIKHVRGFSGEKTVHTPLAQFHSRSFVKPSPYGVVLVVSPWNYPLEASEKAVWEHIMEKKASGPFPTIRAS